MMTSSPGERTAVFFRAAFLAATLTSFLGLGRAIWCDVNRHGVGSPVASQLLVLGLGGLKAKRDNKIKKGPWISPFHASLRKKCAFPRRASLTQRRDYDNTLGRIIPGNLSFKPTRRQFLAPVVSCLPDL